MNGAPPIDKKIMIVGLGVNEKLKTIIQSFINIIFIIIDRFNVPMVSTAFNVADYIRRMFGAVLYFKSGSNRRIIRPPKFFLQINSSFNKKFWRNLVFQFGNNLIAKQSAAQWNISKPFCIIDIIQIVQIKRKLLAICGIDDGFIFKNGIINLGICVESTRK